MAERHDEAAFFEALNRLGPALLSALEGFEQVRRMLHPPRIAALREAVEPLRQTLASALDGFEKATPPEEIQDLHGRLAEAAGIMRSALDEFLAPASPQQGIARVLSSMHLHCKAQQLLYPLRKALRPVSHFFLEPAFRERAEELDPDVDGESPVGIFRVRDPSRDRPTFDLYVPESYDGARPWPLVVALHGGSGTGEDFLWSWLREARGRRFLLMAPTSLGSTWSMMGDDVDAPALRRMVAYVSENWRVDPERILLTGLSDGATYTLLCGLQADMPFTALAPISGVLHPANLSNGNMDRVRGRRIYLVHGELDWMFPIAIARLACDQLRAAGADVVFRPIADLSHTYPRDENDLLLRWFDPTLGLPHRSGTS
jgi:phospholipase/carboxylesterase